MPSYKLMYFDAKGRAEVSRLCFAAADKKFEDVRYTSEEWQKQKPGMPQGCLPVLEIDGKIKICQSLAIARYLANEFNLYGKDNLQRAIVDQILDTLIDLFTPFAKAAFNPNEEEKKKLMEKFTTEEAPKVLGYLENLVKEGGKKGFAVGDRLTVADFALYTTLEMTNTVGVLSKFPRLEENRKTVSSQPRIEKYLKNRPVTKF